MPVLSSYSLLPLLVRCITRVIAFPSQLFIRPPPNLFRLGILLIANSLPTVQVPYFPEVLLRNGWNLACQRELSARIDTNDWFTTHNYDSNQAISIWAI